MRRAVATLAVVVLLGGAGVVRHSRSQTTTPVAASGAPAQRTTTAGTVSSLEGRWLAVTTVGMAAGAHRSSASLWEVTRGADGLVLHERHVVLPDAERRMIERDEVAALASAWDRLPTEPREIARIEHEVLGPDGFTGDVKREPMTADARWVVRQTYTFRPGGSRPMTEVRLFAAESEEPTGHRGRYLTVVLAAAPMPVPIKVPGTFRLIRLPVPSRSIWARIVDTLRGCN
jgi:hypothetical protein